MPQTTVKRSSAVVVPKAPRRGQRVLARLLVVLVKAVSATIRYRWKDRSGHFADAPSSPAIYCLWHNRLAISMAAYTQYIRSRSGGAGLVAMVSASSDGGFLSGVLESFGVHSVRGSSSRRGAQALRELTTWGRRGYDIAITPDGPRGPRYAVQDGVIALAQLTEMPIVPVSARISWKMVIKSWDAFQVPLPFSRCEIFFGPTIRVPRGASEAERETFRVQLEQSLREMSAD